MAKKRVTYTLDEELIERLRKYSDKTMIPQAKIVNEALIEYLNKNEPTKQQAYFSALYAAQSVDCGRFLFPNTIGLFSSWFLNSLSDF